MVRPVLYPQRAHGGVDVAGESAATPGVEAPVGEDDVGDGADVLATHDMLRGACQEQRVGPKGVGLLVLGALW